MTKRKRNNTKSPSNNKSKDIKDVSKQKPETQKPAPKKNKKVAPKQSKTSPKKKSPVKGNNNSDQNVKKLTEMFHEVEPETVKMIVEENENDFDKALENLLEINPEKSSQASQDKLNNTDAADSNANEQPQPTESNAGQKQEDAVDNNNNNDNNNNGLKRSASEALKTGNISAVLKRSKSQPVSAKENQEAKSTSKDDETKLQQRYVATMVLGGSGDAIGYNNGEWEFNFSGSSIHKQLKEIGGVENINVRNMRVSDDTVMHLATAKALISPKYETLEELYPVIAKEYVKCFNDMDNRAPGPITIQAIDKLSSGAEWDEIAYNQKGGGCGAAMRAMCMSSPFLHLTQAGIGLRYPGESQRDNLIAVSIESGRMTHNHPTAFFGGYVSALFTAYAIEGVPVHQWGRKMLDTMPAVYKYIENKKRGWKEYQKDLKYFENSWRNYLQERDLLQSDIPKFPANYGVKERDEFYKKLSWDGWGGSSGHDCVIIAYDALLASLDSWKELVLRAMLHGGDNDSTGSVAGCWYGALFGFKDVPENHYARLEYRDRLEVLGLQLFQAAKPLLFSDK